ncbi:hypothetical protein [Virgibacillus necropolis]|uniref:hypothetical protein n=1 Tax=Virgibacillus necropolis TaxID=163877 RepID=UPI00137475DC|nr:hypothetical protein [Virgibacillus necropolis]
MIKKVKVQSSDNFSYKVGKAVESISVVAPSVKGIEEVGKVVYKRKAEYKKPKLARP